MSGCWANTSKLRSMLGETYQTDLQEKEMEKYQMIKQKKIEEDERRKIKEEERKQQKERENSIDFQLKNIFRLHLIY